MGKGVAALQKVGFIGMTPLASPRIDLIGLYPSMQTILAQVAIVLIIVFSVIYNLRTQKIASPVKGGSLPS
jgi:high-affinity iron transporter